MDATRIAHARANIAATGRDASRLSDADIRKLVAERERRFSDEAPTNAAAAARSFDSVASGVGWRLGPDERSGDSEQR